MEKLQDKDYVIVVQCDIVKERCPGYACEKAFHERSGGFTIYPPGKPARALYLTCGGCCGLTLHRTLAYTLKSIRKQEGISKDRIAVPGIPCRITRSRSACVATLFRVLTSRNSSARRSLGRGYKCRAARPLPSPSFPWHAAQ